MIKSYYWLKDILLNASNDNPNLQYFFHAGESSWQGFVEVNIIDALLLGSKRIGHAFGITKHPGNWNITINKLSKCIFQSEALRLVREQNVALEINPISNQVLQFVSDLRNHPAVSLIQDGTINMVISNDNAAQWEVDGMTHDFYETFMGLSGRDMDIRLLKKLVFNSVEYSALNIFEKEQCMNIVQTKWDEYIDYLNSLK